ncbi:helix-turn-helix transcriptional regulator [Cellulosimicrobium sp. CUA-896]|uniref:helix-turn-helix transcriptional regulator n=1 Tax=Cellulosimicrobium sp. CUA-896 TaxID=1517881 RepID=UPI001C9E1F33|nr:helix-turn-helix transcriptional regulator [Cellulosimicrobium sp. CUA-896]
MFLRTRRDRLTPEEVGLIRGQGVRRTPGLRREELAALAGISIDYYVRLERGTERHPSPAVVESLGRALRLDDDERDHLRRLAAQVDRRDLVPNIAPTRHVRAGVRLILENLRPFPAYVTNRIGDLLAWNPSGLRMLAGIEEWPATRRNVARYAFLHPSARGLYGNWTAQLNGVVSGLRMLAATEPDAADLRDLVGELLVKSPEFAGLWERYDIVPPTEGRKSLHHPVVGDMKVGYQVMQLSGTDGQALLSYYAEPNTPEYDQMLLLDRLDEDSTQALESAAVDADGDPPARS